MIDVGAKHRPGPREPVTIERREPSRLVPAVERREPSQLALAISDIREGLAMWQLWGTLGWHDIRQRYRRSVLGPFWITLSMGIMVAGLSVLWATLFQLSIPEYLPYFALGFIVWTLISSLVIEGCTAFYGSEGVIKQIPVPLSVHVYRIVWRNLIICAHNLTIYVVIMLVLGIWPGVTGFLLAILGFALLAVIGTALGFLFGILSARYRDIPPLVMSILQMAFFFSPILWKPESLPDRQYMVTYNPFYYLIEIVRRPLLGIVPDLTTFATVVGITLLTCLVAGAFFVRFRKRIAYWV